MAARSTEATLVAKLHKIYSTHIYVNECLVPEKEVAVRRDGYRRCHLTYPGELSVNTTLHRAVYILEKRDPSLIRNKSAGEVSHRCGNKTCINIRHLVLEQPSANSLRRSCHRDRRCYGCSPSCIIRPRD